MKIRVKDTVQIMTGKNRGSQGVVERVLPEEGRIIIGGLNLVKRHQKKQGDRQPGGIIEKPAPLDVSNVMLICPHCQLKTRVGYRIEGDKKVRICKHCQKELKA